MPGDPPLLLALGSSAEYGAAMGATLGVPLSPLEEQTFEDGEHKSRPLVSVRGRDVYVVWSLYGEPEQSVSDKLCRLLFLLGALKDASAASVTAVVPYLAFARKDRRTEPRDPVTTRYVASLFEAVGTDRVVTLDVHNLAAFENAFRCPTDHLEARGLFVRFFAPLLDGAEVTVVSPDVGGIKRAERFRKALAERLGHPVATAFMEKKREQGTVSGDALVGDVRGRTVIILDDLISTGTTMFRAAGACRGAGAGQIYAAATHGLFSGDAARLMSDRSFDRIVVTDSVPPFRLPAELVPERVGIVSAAPLFAEAIRRIHEHRSLADLAD